jgi:hypothetical protein
MKRSIAWGLRIHSVDGPEVDVRWSEEQRAHDTEVVLLAERQEVVAGGNEVGRYVADECRRELLLEVDACAPAA